MAKRVKEITDRLMPAPQEQPIRKEHPAAQFFLLSALCWLIFGVVAAMILAVKFRFPDFLGGFAGYLSFGRVRPVHVNAVLFGWLSMGQIGAILYIVPRLTGIPLHSEKLAIFTGWVWNIALAAGLLAILLGYTEGREYAEFITPIDYMVMAGLVLLLYNIGMTVAKRKEKHLYVSLWYFLGTFCWFTLIYLIGNRAFFVRLEGLNDGVVNWFYGHNVLGLWFTTAGVGIVYYLLPVLTRNPLWSHKWSLIGFWTIGLFYAPIGAHHLLQAPIPEWLKGIAVTSSVLLLIPVLTVLANFFMTISGKWGSVADNIALKFTVAGAFHYLITCVQGPLQATRGFNWYIHFTNWVVAHAHMALLGAFSFWIFAAMYYILPRVSGKEYPSKAMANVHFWTTFIGFQLFFWTLTIAGLIQGADWNAGIPIQTTQLSMAPYMFVRLLAGLVMFVGQVVFAYHTFLWLKAARGWEKKIRVVKMPGRMARGTGTAPAAGESGTV